MAWEAIEMDRIMKPKIYYNRETDILSIWNEILACEAEDVAENLVADFDDEGEVKELPAKTPPVFGMQIYTVY